ncbi:MAG: FAD:protein FMN transferase [Christensenellaceae bacterium]|nr:FAD:protein FMN transferase [Christensenellaceae bacterium]
MKRRLLSLLIVLFMVFPSIQATEYKKYSHVFFGTFDTVITIIGYAEDKETFDSVAKLAEEKFNIYHKLFDCYNEYDGITNIYTVNEKAYQSPVVVPKELFDLIKLCKEEQSKLNNTLNIAMGSVLSLWHDARDYSTANPDKAYLPDMDKLIEASKHTNIDDVILDDKNSSIFIKDSELKINLGAVAKGYATELVAQEMLNSSMPSFIINAGGNVRTGNTPLDGRENWGVGVQDPFDPSGVFETIFLHDLSVVTSGDYQRYYEVDGKLYNHIISQETLYPADFMHSVTIVTEDSGLADMLSTVLFLMPYEDGKEFLKNYPNVGAVWYLMDGSIIATDNIKNMLGSKLKEN